MIGSTFRRLVRERTEGQGAKIICNAPSPCPAHRAGRFFSIATMPPDATGRHDSQATLGNDKDTPTGLRLVRAFLLVAVCLDESLL
jgi:hypothetical protein